MDLQRELGLLQRRGYDFYQQKMGEVVLWFEYVAEEHTGDSIFDEGGRTYRPPCDVPVLWVTETEDYERNTEAARRVTPTLRFAVSVQAMRRSGVSDPTSSRRHLNDVVVYKSTYWSVGSYDIHGRLGQSDVIIGVNATKIHPSDDMVFDTLPDFGGIDATTRPRGDLTDDYHEWPEQFLPASGGRGFSEPDDEDDPDEP